MQDGYEAYLRILTLNRVRVAACLVVFVFTLDGMAESTPHPEMFWANFWVRLAAGAFGSLLFGLLLLANRAGAGLRPRCRSGAPRSHLRRMLRTCFTYDHQWRCHQGLAGDCPEPRRVQSQEKGSVVEVRESAGLFRHYERRTA